MKLEYTVQIWREDKQFIAHAMPIDVVSSGDTPELARVAVDEAVKLFVESISEMGTLQQVLEDAGYRLIDGKWERQAWNGVEHRSVMVEV